LYPNSVLRTEFGGSFNRSPERQRDLFTYTAPGSMPSNLSDQYSAEFDPYAGAKAFTSGAATGAMLVPSVVDAALMTLRGGGKLASALPFLGSDFAQGVEAAIPEPFAARAVENILLNQQREQIAQKTGELPFTVGNLAGNITSPFLLASKVPAAAKLMDTAFDISSATPGASQYLSGATNIGQMIGRGAQVGLAGSLLPAVDTAYNATAGTTDLGAGLLTLGAGMGLGGAIGALPGVVKSGKEIIDNISNTVKQRSTQSDTVATMRQMSQRRYEMQQQQNMLAQQQAEKLPVEAPQMLEPTSSVYSGAGVGEKTVAPRLKNSFPVVENTNAPVDFVQNIDQKITEYDQFRNQLLAERETEIPLQPIKRTDVRKQIIEEKMQNWQSEKDQLLQQKQLAEQKLANFEEDLSWQGQQIQESLPNQIPPEQLLVKLKSEISTIDNQITKLDKQINKPSVTKSEYETRFKTLQEERMSQASKQKEERNATIDNTLSELEAEQTALLEQYYLTQAKSKPQLPAIIPKPSEPIVGQEARFTAGANGIRDAETNVIAGRPVETTPKEGQIGRWNVKAKRAESGLQSASFENIPREPIKQPMQNEATPEKLDAIDNIKRNVNSSDRFTPIISKISRLSPKLGAAIAKFAVAPQVIEQRIIEEIAPLLKVLKKYENDPVMRKAYGNISQLGYDAIPDPEYRKALEDFQVIANKYRTQLNEKGMEIGAPYEIYGPRGYDMAKLEEKLGPILSAEYRKLEPRVQEKYLSRKLEKERTIPEITDEIVDAFSPLKGVENWVRNTSEKLAEAELFGNTTGDYGTNIMNLVSKYQKDFTPSKDNKNIQEAVSTLDEVFGNKDLARSKGYKMLTSLLSAINYTGKGTGLSQANDAVTSLARNGVFETLEGAVDTIRTIVPNASKQPILQQTLKKVGALENAESFTDTGQLDKFFDIFGLLKSKQFKEAGIKSLENAGIAASKANYLVLRMFDIAGKKLNVLAAHNKFKRNPKLISDDIAMYEVDPEKRIAVMEYYNGFKRNKNQKYEPIPLEVLTYLSNHALAYHVKSSFDRTLGAISRGDIERLAQFGFGFATKYAVTAQDRLRADMENAFKSRSFIKPAKVIAEKTLKMAAAVGGVTVLGLMSQGYNIMGEEGLPVGWDDVGKTAFQGAVGLGSPMLSRAVGLADAGLRGDVGNADTQMQALNQVFRGSGNALKLGSDLLAFGGEGRLGDFFNPNTNTSSFKLIPPRYITETIYENSREGRNAKTKLEIYKATQEGAKQQELDNQYQRAAKALQKHQFLDPEDVRILTQGTRGTTEYKNALSRAESALSNLKQYGTTDLEAASPAIIERNSMRQKVLQGLVQTQQDFAAGTIDRNEFAQRMAQYKMLKKRYNLQ
jgi:hypothetical protein